MTTKQRRYQPTQGDDFLPPDTFKGRTVLVTGGSSGMGLGMARGFARTGANVALLGRSKEKAVAAAEELEKECQTGATTIGLSGDVRSADAIASAFAEAEDALGVVSILANNAGGNFPVVAENISTNAWLAITRIAIEGTYLCSLEFFKRLKRAGLEGQIVNNSAQYIWNGFPGDAHSVSAKTAVATMTRAFARDWAEHGVRTNCVAAGMFPHDQATAMGGSDPQVLKTFSEMVPAGRVGVMKEFGWVSTFLCSPFASAINGQILMIDGGDSLRRSLISPPYVPVRDRAPPWGPWGYEGEPND